MYNLADNRPVRTWWTYKSAYKKNLKHPYRSTYRALNYLSNLINGLIHRLQSIQNKIEVYRNNPTTFNKTNLITAIGQSYAEANAILLLTNVLLNNKKTKRVLQEKNLVQAVAKAHYIAKNYIKGDYQALNKNLKGIVFDITPKILEVPLIQRMQMKPLFKPENLNRYYSINLNDVIKELSDVDSTISSVIYSWYQ